MQKHERQDITSSDERDDATSGPVAHPDVEVSDTTQFWDTIRRAEASFHRQDRASRRFHEAKQRVDQTLRRLSGATHGQGFDDYEGRHSSGGDISPGPTGDTEPARQTGEAHEEITPIIDAMESRAARVEELVKEMEWLLIDVESLLDRTQHS